MKCHYELLEVERNADDDVIKKSYRKLALKWHPDKNPDRIEECTQYFALLQQAYDVLSDPHERAFYDKHRESILKGGFGQENYEDKSLDLFQYFTTTCYKGFEGPKSFYEVYKDVFAKLADEDYEYLDDSHTTYPRFGDAGSDYDSVVGPFYGFWSSFCTARSFHWLDKYDIREAENRYQTRAIEAENKKYRDAGKAERNDQVRELVAFVRKRDPRIKAYREELERRQVEAKLKQEENRRNQLRRNQELFAKDSVLEEQNRAHFENLLAEQAEEEEMADEDEELADDIPHCVACNKSFKSIGALESHKNSKQHKKQLTELMRHMKEEDAAIFEDLTAANPSEQPEKKGKKAKRRAKKKKAWDEPDSSAEEGEEGGELPPPEEPKVEEKVVEEPPTVEEKKGKKARRAKKKNKKWDEDSNGEEGEAAAGLSQNVENITLEEPEDEDEEAAAPKTGRCDKCGEFFESRTKLFQHIRQTGHASLKFGAEDSNKKNKKGKRK